MNLNNLPDIIPNWIDGEESEAISKDTFGKLSPATGKELCKVVRSRTDDVQKAVAAARNAQPAWANLTPVQRGDLLYEITRAMRKYRQEIAAIVAAETGMAPGAALGETGGAIALGEFMAGEGRRFYGRTTTSAVTQQICHDRAAAAGGRRTDYCRQHAHRQCSLEGVSGIALRQQCRAESRRGHTGHGLGFRQNRP